MAAVAERSHADILPDSPLSRPGFRDNAAPCYGRSSRPEAILMRRGRSEMPENREPADAEALVKRVAEGATELVGST